MAPDVYMCFRSMVLIKICGVEVMAARLGEGPQDVFGAEADRRSTPALGLGPSPQEAIARYLGNYRPLHSNRGVYSERGVWELRTMLETCLPSRRVVPVFVHPASALQRAKKKARFYKLDG